MDSSIGEEESLQEGEKSATRMDNLPAKSRDIYLKAYESFMEWWTSVGAKNFSEPVLLAYFKEQAKKKQASTLWVTYSMLRATLSANHNVLINGYPKLLMFLKSQAKGHKSKKSNVFTAENVETFLEEAPDEIYLVIKVGLVFGICGACRAAELIRIRPEDVQKHSDQAMLVNLYSSSSPSKLERSFVIRDEYVKIVEKYQALRPPDTELDRFFINYQQGKCTRQAIGKQKLSEFPKKIAQFLNLPNPETYTGHCLRRTSACLLAQSGADAVLLKQCGGWKSTNGIAEYLEGTYTKRTRIDPPRIMPQPTENEQAEFLLDDTQQFECTINDTPHFESTVNETQSESRLNTQETQTQWSDFANNIPQNQWNESLLDPQAQQTQLKSESLAQQESMLNDTQTRWSEGVDDSQSMKSDDPFDFIPDKYVMPPSPRPHSPSPARCPPRTPLITALERRRLRLDEVRAKQLHARELARLRVEARRVEVDQERNEVLRRIADVTQAWAERLSQL
ncbi:uncharacterized protein [Choristoneura fumiferana]|uniref:uncharacterized protein n=1 Tax=Choristoneura fumiferana TaxID=7141 RepID=UPI003D156DE6